jgi:argininosuccinate lyase
MLLRDKERFWDTYNRTDSLPLGACALAGTSYNIDREFVKEELGFSRICLSTMDAVSDRDFALEFIFSVCLTMMHLSRFCEEIVYWNSKEFDFVEIDDAYSTGSSIMPQKKNPDMAELIRGKTGRVYGDLMALLTVMKGLPLAYNKDMQEDKEPVFDAGDTLKDALEIFTQMLATMVFKKENMEMAARKGFMNATDAADYLVKKGVPFRDCHEIIGSMVLGCLDCGKAIEELELDELKAYSPLFDSDIYAAIELKTLIKARKQK